MGILRIVGSFFAAVIIGAILVTAAQTQINLQSLIAVGAEIPMDVRMDATLRDLAALGPLTGAVLAIGFLIAFVTTGFIVRRAASLRLLGYTLAGAVAVLAAFYTIQWLFAGSLGSIITVFAAMRSLAGIGVMALGGAIAGLAYAQMLGRPAR
jgi:hypothetical protein